LENIDSSMMVFYDIAVRIAFVEPMVISLSLKKMCWPLIQVFVTREFLCTCKLQEEFEHDLHLIGHLYDRPKESFHVGQDFFWIDFIWLYILQMRILNLSRFLEL
jgi:hypothetical protein